MTEKFKEQGGAATMDPSAMYRWLSSKVMNRMFDPKLVLKRRLAAEKKRKKLNEPHTVEYFHQVDDGYSHLTAQVLERFRDRYDINLECHLVSGPQGKNVAEPDLLQYLSRYDSHKIAASHGLEFPHHPEKPNSELVNLALRILASQDSAGFIQHAAEVGRAVWAKDVSKLENLAKKIGETSPGQAQRAIEQGCQRRAELKHYSGAMFYYAGEWYWGIDRLYHLEQRLQELDADKSPEEPLIVPRKEIQPFKIKDSGTLMLEVYPSLRSPYTTIAFDRAIKLVQDAGVKLSVRPVLPMVMRGVPVTREKGVYIFTDAVREARAAGVPYGQLYDPIGAPVRHCYALYPWAVVRGRGNELLSSFLRHAFVLGVNTNNDKGLRRVVESAGLDWNEAQSHRQDDSWEALLEENRQAMYTDGVWGVPSFKVLDPDGKVLLAIWGQDRLWLVADTINHYLASR